VFKGIASWRLGAKGGKWRGDMKGKWDMAGNSVETF